MFEKYLHIKGLSKFIFAFYILICISPAMHILLIGSNEMKNFYEFFITSIPDFFLFFICLYSFLFYIQNRKVSFVRFDFIVLIFALINILYGFIRANDLLISLRGFRITYLSVAFYFIARFYEKEFNNAFQLLKKIFYWLLIFGVMGIVLHYLFNSFELYLIKKAGYPVITYFIPRISSFILTPVIFGSLISGSCLFFYYLLLKEGKVIYYFIIGILGLCMVLSVSRGPILSFIIVAILMSIIFKAWKQSFIMLLIILIISALISYYYTGSMSIVNWFFSSTADTLNMGDKVKRVSLWRNSLDDFFINPFGYGLGKAGHVAHRFLLHTNVPSAPDSTDGWFLKVACENGILGIISYLIFSFLFFKKCIKQIFLDRKSFLTFLFCYFLLINFQNIVANTLDYYPYNILFWFIVGVSMNMVIEKETI